MDFCCDCNVTQDVTATYGNIAKVVCAAESQQSAVEFISVDCDLCRSGEVSFRQRNQRPRRACSYMDFCCDGNVTLDVTVICCVGSMA